MIVPSTSSLLQVKAVGSASATGLAIPGEETYRNPIIHADYSDPDVVRSGDHFYMTASSFNCTPGLPILHSINLVDWELVNHAVRQLPHPRFYAVQPGQGIWAPSIRLHSGKFWIFFAMPDEGIYQVTADHPEDAWSEPHLVIAGKGMIDPCPLWDEDGQAYLIHAYACSRVGTKHRLRVCPMAPEGTHLLGEGQVVFYDPDRHPTLEGPKFLKKDGWYYVLAPAGGVTSGWQVALRSRHIYGPYEDRILLHQGGTPVNGPHQGALIDLPSGEWWFIHFQDAGVYGRIVHLQPVEWREDWPLIGDLTAGKTIGCPVLRHRRPTVNIHSPRLDTSMHDDFDSATLDLRWQWHANSHDRWYSLTEKPGSLRLYSQKLEKRDLASVGNLLLQKFPARSFAIETTVALTGGKAGDTAGLVIMGLEHAMIGIRASGKRGLHRLVFLINNLEKEVHDYLDQKVTLRVRVDAGGICTFSYAGTKGQRRTITERFLAKPGMWIGAKAGLVAASMRSGDSTSYADFDYFRISIK